MPPEYDPHNVIASVERDRENGLDDGVIPALYRSYDANVNAPADECAAGAPRCFLRQALFEYAMEVIVDAANLLERHIDEGRAVVSPKTSWNDIRTTEETRLADLRQRALNPEA